MMMIRLIISLEIISCVLGPAFFGRTGEQSFWRNKKCTFPFKDDAPTQTFHTISKKKIHRLPDGFSVLFHGVILFQSFNRAANRPGLFYGNLFACFHFVNCSQQVFTAYCCSI